MDYVVRREVSEKAVGQLVSDGWKRIESGAQVDRVEATNYQRMADKYRNDPAVSQKSRNELCVLAEVLNAPYKPVTFSREKTLHFLSAVANSYRNSFNEAEAREADELAGEIQKGEMSPRKAYFIFGMSTMKNFIDPQAAAVFKEAIKSSYRQWSDEIDRVAEEKGFWAAAYSIVATPGTWIDKALYAVGTQPIRTAKEFFVPTQGWSMFTTAFSRAYENPTEENLLAVRLSAYTFALDATAAATVVVPTVKTSVAVLNKSIAGLLSAETREAAAETAREVFSKTMAELRRTRVFLYDQRGMVFPGTAPITETTELLEKNLPKVLGEIDSSNARNAIKRAFAEVRESLMNLRKEVAALDTDVATMEKEVKTLSGAKRSEMTDKLISKRALRNQLVNFDKEAVSQQMHDLMYGGDIWAAQGRERPLKILKSLRNAREELKKFREVQLDKSVHFMDTIRIKRLFDNWMEGHPSVKGYLNRSFTSTSDKALENLTQTVGLRLDPVKGGSHPFQFHGIDYSVGGVSFKGEFLQPVPVYLSKKKVIAAGGVDFAQQIETQLRNMGMPVNSDVMKILIFGNKEEAQSLLEHLMSH